MADGDATIRLGPDGVTARILAKEAKTEFRRVEQERLGSVPTSSTRPTTHACTGVEQPTDRFYGGYRGEKEMTLAATVACYS